MPSALATVRQSRGGKLPRTMPTKTCTTSPNSSATLLVSISFLSRWRRRATAKAAHQRKAHARDRYVESGVSRMKTCKMREMRPWSFSLMAPLSFDCPSLLTLSDPSCTRRVLRHALSLLPGLLVLPAASAVDCTRLTWPKMSVSPASGPAGPASCVCAALELDSGNAAHSPWLWPCSLGSAASGCPVSPLRQPSALEEADWLLCPCSCSLTASPPAAPSRLLPVSFARTTRARAPWGGGDQRTGEAPC